MDNKKISVRTGEKHETKSFSDGYLFVNDAEKRKENQTELDRLQNLISESVEGEARYFTNIIAGVRLYEMASAVKGFKKRDCYETIERFLYGKASGKVCALFGLQGTGKTTLLYQAILGMNNDDFEKTAYIKLSSADTMAKLNFDMKRLVRSGYKYIFIDEALSAKEFIDSAAFLPNLYAAMGIKIVLSSADSLGFWFAADEELYDSIEMIHTTFIPYKEYVRLLGTENMGEYIKYGGVLGAKGSDWSKKKAEGNSFYDYQSTKHYIDNAVSKNIQNALVNYQDGGNFRHLYSLYEAGELTETITRVVENINQQFVLEVLTGISELNDSEDRAIKAITNELTEILRKRNQEEQKIGITKTHIAEIEEYLKALDLIYYSPVETLEFNAKPYDNIIFTQPGMRYCQAQALVHSLIKEKVFAEQSKLSKKLLCERILNEIKRRMLEDIVLLETSNSHSKKRYKIFNLRLDADKFNMVIHDRSEHVCSIYKIKHSDKVVETQEQQWSNEIECLKEEQRFGDIVKKCILYQGKPFQTDDGIVYENVNNYLGNLFNNTFSICEEEGMQIFAEPKEEPELNI